MPLATVPISDGELLYAENFLAATDANSYLRTFQDDIQWEQHQITIFGRQRPTPRLSAWHGDPDAHYTYSGLALEPRPWTTALQTLKAQLETATDTHFNSVLLIR